jgi:hypothetical protein
MELTEILEYLQRNDTDGMDGFQKLRDRMTNINGGKQIDSFLEQYDPKQHKILKTPDKTIENAEETFVVVPARIAVAYQQFIVDQAAAFLCGNPIELLCETKDLEENENFLSIIKKIWDDNKLDYESKKIAKVLMSETEVAELWWAEPLPDGSEYWNDTPLQGLNIKFRFRMMLLAHSLQDVLAPIFNRYGDLIAFGRGYTIVTDDKKNEQHFDVYLDNVIYYGTKAPGALEWEVKEQSNFFGKIPIVFYTQKVPEWWYVSEMIDRLETLLSKHADTNDYVGSPMTVVKGKILSFAKKGESGKVIEVEPNADVSYLTWNSAPASIQLEIETLIRLIHDLTSTAHITKDKPEFSGPVSGTALLFRFLASHLKAADKEEVVGKGVQRRINLLKAAAVMANGKWKPVASKLPIKPGFKYYLPKNIEETINLLSIATGGKPLMSRKTAVEQNPLIQNPKEENELIDAQEEKDLNALNPFQQDQP